MIKEFSYKELLNITLKELMQKNKNIVSFGLGIDDPKNIFGTTAGMVEKFGKKRVFDTPTSENALTGIGIGMSLNGIIPIMTHQRMDFFLLAFDQLINNAAKWKYMFGNKKKVPIVIRLIVGRGWGQGPTHSQNFQSLFVNTPGIKVLTPSLPSTARNLLIEAVKEKDPVIIIEHRWLHNIKEKYSLKKKYKKNTSGINVLSKGKDLTIISWSYSTIEIMKIYKILKQNKISFDHLDILSLKPINFKKIYNSVKKTKRLLILDNTSHKLVSLGGDIISQLVLKNKNIFNAEPVNLSLPDIPSPTSYYLSKNFYNSSSVIIKKIEKILNKKISQKNINIEKSIHHDVPDMNFSGPF
tara:strand:+ start:521 stop:1585 length:1065 start_codon:yes stop_codon:yes gene_type:complete